MQQLRTGVCQMDRQVSELRPMEHIQGDKLRLRFVREILVRTLHAHIIVSSLSQPSHKAKRNTGAGRQPHRHARCRAQPCVRRRPGRGAASCCSEANRASERALSPCRPSSTFPTSAYSTSAERKARISSR